MNWDGVFLHSFGVWTVPVCLLRIRGELAMGHLRATDLYAVGSFDPDHDAAMRIGGEAPGGGPILSVGISAMFVLRFPPPRILSSAAREKPARAPNGVEWYARSVSPFSPLDVRRRPPVSRPS